MNKWEWCLDSTTFTIELVFYNLFIFYLKSVFMFFGTQVGKVFIKSWSSTYLGIGAFVEIH